MRISPFRFNRLTLLAASCLAVLAAAPAYATPTEITVRARTTGAHEGAELLIGYMASADLTWANELVVSATYATTAEFADYTLTVDGDVNPRRVRAYFSNDDGGPRDLEVDYMRVGGETFESEGTSTYAVGSFDAATGCAPGYKSSEVLNCVGYFHYAVPPPPTTIYVRARSRGEAGDAEMMIAYMDSEDYLVPARIPGNVIQSRTVTTSPEFGVYAFTPDVEGELRADRVRVYFTNDDGERRDLEVDYVTIGAVRYLTEAEDTYSTGTFDAAAGCAPGFKRGTVLNCAGYFHYDTGDTAVPETVIEVVARSIGDPSSPAEMLIAVTAEPKTHPFAYVTGVGAERAFSVGPEFAHYPFTFRGKKVGPSQVRVYYTNDNGDRDLEVDYVVVDGERVEAEDPANYSTANCSPDNNEASAILYCDGFVQFLVGGAPHPGAARPTLGSLGADVAQTAVFPNPSHGSIHVAIGQEAESRATVRLVDAAGRVVEELTGVSAGERVTFAADLPAGRYAVWVRTAGDTRVFPVSVVR